MENKRIARIARDSFLNTPVFQGFSDIRKNPVIKLRTILMSLFLMPLFGMRSLLSNDRETRTRRYKGLFDCRRKMVASDSTFARVLRWLKLQQAQQFLLSFLPVFEKRDLLRKRLSPRGRLRRVGIVDGSFMGGHWLVTLCLAGQINYPLMIRRCENRGDEQAVARSMIQEAPAALLDSRPQLWLLDSLYFNVNTIRLIRKQKAHVLFKVKDAEFRTVTADADNLFRHYGGDKEQTGSDPLRHCRWKALLTQDTFAGSPVAVLHVIEHYPKRRRNRDESFWIVTTDLALSIEEAREAAHQRWQIENNVFKRISHLSATKRFHFKDPRQFFNMLHIFFAAVAVLDYIIALLRDHRRLFAALRAGIKVTWLNVFCCIRETLYDLPCALSRIA
jgi:hypothetical protein